MKNITVEVNKLQTSGLSGNQFKSYQGKKFSLRLLLGRIWQQWIAEFNASNDPKIWRTIDRLGNSWWHAYNPITGCSATRESETEILECIDRGVTGE